MPCGLAAKRDGCAADFNRKINTTANVDCIVKTLFVSLCPYQDYPFQICQKPQTVILAVLSRAKSGLQ
jgi:hypothetical protein